jgi:hypothetical protein
MSHSKSINTQHIDVNDTGENPHLRCKGNSSKWSGDFGSVDFFTVELNPKVLVEIFFG